ncbi:hypothetical protein RB195_002071 [Necator americanus]|uniref:GDNF/GAS1 domain-containing protein n=1 Tax=Necator americanus TaxID=51031 RepID=A0ABR1DI09_NECAM
MRHLLLLGFVSICSAYNGCLHQRSVCLRTPECHEYIDKFENICGYSLGTCTIDSPSNCVHTLWRIRDFFPYDTCVCYEALGFPEECNQFRELIWNHPCERRMRDAGEQRRAKERSISVEQHSQHPNSSVKRTTRTPLSDQIRQLKTELSGELGTREVLRRATCDSALNDVCLRHVSCRQLWKLFRSSCGVDQDNRCTMADRETCWQSFEGLTWTGLGNCHCDSANSDCHWIRLHTNYNKCIHDISLAGQFPAIGVISTNGAIAPSTARYGHRSKIEMIDKLSAARIVPTTTATRTIPRTTPGSTITTTTTTTTSTTFTTTASTTTTTRPPRTRSNRTRTSTPKPLVNLWNQRQPQGEARTTTAPSWWRTTTPSALSHSNQQRHVVLQTQADVHYRPLFEQHVRTTPTYYYYYTTAIPPRWDRNSHISPPQNLNDSNAQTDEYRQSTVDRKLPEKYPPNNRWNLRETSQRINGQSMAPTQATFSEFTQAEYSFRSSCQDTMARCEAADECRWHLGELRVRCAPNTCRRAECAAALQRFARFVPFSLVESMMFCHCSAGDTICAQQQEILYPKCLYSTSSMAMTCTEAARKCDADHRCRHLRHSLSANCPIAHDECAKTSLDECRRTILHARASILEQPCYCPLSDVECMAHQRTMIPNNPCIEKAMLDYSRLMGYNSPTAVKSASIETNRVYENNVEKAAPKMSQSTEKTSMKDPSSRGQEKTRIVVDSRGVTRSGLSGSEFRKAADYGEGGHSQKVAETNQHRSQYRAKSWKEKTGNTETENERSEHPKSETDTGSSRTDQQHRPSATKDDEEAEIEVESVVPTTPKPTVSTWIPTHRKTHLEHSEGRRKGKHRTTTSPVTSTEPPPWITTTQQLPTTTTTFITHAPPPAEGCNAKDASGRQIFVHIGSVIRRYVDWSGRCSSWCECLAEDQLSCERLPCLEDGRCEAPLATVDFGERLFLRDRGACFCESGTFICDLPEEMPEVYPGLYLSAGYSTTDIDMLRSEIPSDVLERAGFLSSDAATDIAGRLQIAFERILPKDLQCRIVLMPEMSEPGSAFMRIEWFGKNEALNHTKTQWHTGWAEKACSAYVMKLSDYFSLSESPRFQLVLSSVKQLKVLDYLDGLPSSTLNIQHFTLALVKMSDSSSEDKKSKSPEENKKSKRQKKEKIGKNNNEKKAEKRRVDSDSSSDEGVVDKTPVKKSKSGGNRVKNADGEEMIEIGSMRYVNVRNFRGKSLIDVREYYMDKASGVLRPGKKGISLTREQYENFKAIMSEIDSKLGLSMS